MNKSISKKNGEEQVDKNKCLRKENQYALEWTVCEILKNKKMFKFLTQISVYVVNLSST